GRLRGLKARARGVVTSRKTIRRVQRSFLPLMRHSLAPSRYAETDPRGRTRGRLRRAIKTGGRRPGNCSQFRFPSAAPTVTLGTLHHFQARSEVRLMPRYPLVTLSLFLSLFVSARGLYAQEGQRNLTRDRTGKQKWALLIGVDDYAYVNKLESCGQDMRSLRERLLGSGFQDRQVFLLHDKADVNKYRPFKENIGA